MICLKNKPFIKKSQYFFVILHGNSIIRKLNASDHQIDPASFSSKSIVS